MYTQTHTHTYTTNTHTHTHTHTHPDTHTNTHIPNGQALGYGRILQICIKMRRVLIGCNKTCLVNKSNSADGAVRVDAKLHCMWSRWGRRSTTTNKISPETCSYYIYSTHKAPNLPPFTRYSQSPCAIPWLELQYASVKCKMLTESRFMTLYIWL